MTRRRCRGNNDDFRAHPGQIYNWVGQVFCEGENDFPRWCIKPVRLAMTGLTRRSDSRPSQSETCAIAALLSRSGIDSQERVPRGIRML